MSIPAFAYKSSPNGPLAPRARKRRIILSQVDIMIEDRDAQKDLSREPDLSDFPDWACQFLGANLSTEDTEAEVDDDLDDGFYPDIEDDALSAEEQLEMKELNAVHGTDFYHPEDLLTLRYLDTQRWVEETYGEHPDFWPTTYEEEIEQERQDARQHAAHMRDVVYGHPYDAYGMTIITDQDWGDARDDGVVKDEAVVGTESAVTETNDKDGSGAADIPSEAEIAEEEAHNEHVLDMTSMSQYGGPRGQRAVKGVARNLCRPHHFLAIAS